MDPLGSGQRSVAGSCGHGNEVSSSVKDGDFFDWLPAYQVLKSTRTPFSCFVTHGNL
jgi:hypothetical protein